jgi:4-hydroxy-4-methyl-2-oxoglutarate aldolase
MSPSLEPAVAARLLELGTATLYEASGIDFILDAALRPVWPGARVCGTALPLRASPEDNLALHLAVERAQPGDVLVADAGGLACGYWGEILAVAAQVRGVAGLVVDGGVRDVDRLAELRFPVWSRWISVRRTAKERHEGVGVTTVVAGVAVEPGDVVVADADGVIVLPSARVDEIAAAGEERLAKEDGFLERIRAGESTVDLFGLRDRA